MKISEALSLVRMGQPELNRVQRFRARCHTVADVEAAARRALPRPVFDYIAGGADDEVTLAENVGAYTAWRFQPQVLRDVAEVDLSTEILGRRSALRSGSRRPDTPR